MKKLLLILSAAALLQACGGKNGAETSTADAAKDSLLLRIHGVETAINTNMKAAILDPHLASQAVQYYTEFAKAYPKDTNAPMFLFRASDIECNAMHQYDQALGMLNTIISDYPQFRKLPICYFQVGVIYDDNLNDDQKAKEAYEKFLANYPNHPLAPQVKALISYLGKSNEELLKEFEQKNK
jgi:TolA-binding protein